MAKILRVVVLVSLSLPFLWLVSLALLARSTKGSFRLAAPDGNILNNFASALSGSDGSDFLRAYITTFSLSGVCAVTAVVLALPAARLLARRGPVAAQNLTAAFVATRLVPVTAALVILERPFGLADLPLGLPTLSIIYLALFLPVATACIASADFAALDRARVLCELDAPLSRRWKWRLLRSLLAGDAVVAGLLVFLFIWSEFYISVRLSEPGETTLARYFSTFETINGVRWGSLAASLVICLIPIVVGLGLISIRLARR